MIQKVINVATVDDMLPHLEYIEATKHLLEENRINAQSKIEK